MRVAGDLNLDGNEVKNVVIDPLGSPPSSRPIGRWYYDEALHTLRVWTGNAFEYVKLLLHCNGTGSSTPFLDSSSSAHVITPRGDVQIVTAQKRFGTGSGLFDGTGDYLEVPDSSDWDFGSGDFTVDFWFRPSVSVGGTQTGLFDQFYTSRAWSISYTDTRLYFNWSTDGSSVSGDYRTASFTAGNWYHIAVVRSDDEIYLFVDGQLLSTTISIGTDTIYNSTVALYIGAYHSGDTSAAGFFNGYMDEMRISKGTARWTSNFTPPVVEHVSDEYTKLLLHCNYNGGSTSFPDSSWSTHVVTSHDNVQVDIAQKVFGTGSALFDGNGDYLSVPDSVDWDFGGGDFTIDLWMKLPRDVGRETLIDQFGTSKAWGLKCTTGDLRFYYSTGPADYTISQETSFSSNVWYHVALVRHGSALKFFVNGTQIGSDANMGSDVIYDSSVSLFVGAAHSGGDSPDEFFYGWLDEVRISKGIARWTSNFIPPFAECTSVDLDWLNVGTSVGVVLPVGTVLPVFYDGIPSSYLECDGSVLSRTTYADLFAVIGTTYGNTSGSDFKLPDYRGCFLRGWDHGAGNDPNAADRTDRGDGTTGDYVGTRQEDQFRRHTHYDYMCDEDSGNCAAHAYEPFQVAEPYRNESSYGGNETRPLNIYCMYCIKYTA